MCIRDRDPTLAASNYCIIRSNSERDSTMKTFNISSDRILHLAKNNEITIREKATKKAAVFTPARWASFLQCVNEIDHQLGRLTSGEDVGYCMHYGAAWHVSLTNDFCCIDLRKFYVPFCQTCLLYTSDAADE